MSEEKQISMQEQAEIAKDAFDRPGEIVNVATVSRFPIMQFFEYGHLPHVKLRDISMNCAELAAYMVNQGLYGPEMSAGLRKLLEAKDCFVRAAVAQNTPESG